MPPAARITDMHTCPMVNPGPVPHVGGPDISGSPNVITGFMPQARVTDSLVCVPAIDKIAKGSPTVLVNNLMAARIGDQTVHGGVIVAGCPTVIIGESGQASTLRGAAKDGTPFCEECEKAKKAAEQRELAAAPPPNAPPPGSADTITPAGKETLASVAQESSGVPETRKEYERLVRSIKPMADAALAKGVPIENVAEWAHQTRRAFGLAYKGMTPPDLLAHIYARNIDKYGDPLGPTIAYHHEEKGRSWAEIIDKAATPDGGDIKKLMEQMPPMTVENIDSMLEKLDTPAHAQETAHAIEYLKEQRALLNGSSLPPSGGP